MAALKPVPLMVAPSFVSLVQPRYATLPNIMKAKKKPMEQLTPEVGGPNPVAVGLLPCTGATTCTIQDLGGDLG